MCHSIEKSNLRQNESPKTEQQAGKALAPQKTIGDECDERTCVSKNHNDESHPGQLSKIIFLFD
jgi:hypothetical protein